MNKVILATIQSVILLSLLLPAGVAAAAPQTTQAPIFGVHFPLTVKVTDSFGNIYTLTATGSAASYTISGTLSSSPYLAYTPWTVSGSGHGKHFSFTNNDPNPSDPNFCSWTITATVSGSAATGSWVNLGCGGGGGSVTLTACTKHSCASTANSPNGHGLPGT